MPNITAKEVFIARFRLRLCSTIGEKLFNTQESVSSFHVNDWTYNKFNK